jgi:hypothetical protein
MLQITKLAYMVSALAVLASCGGGAKTPPPPGPDFSVSASPVSASAVLGNVTSAVTISVAPERGFNNTVDVSLQGLPQGVDATPSSFSLNLGASQSVTFSVSPSAAVGMFHITVLATSGTLSHSALLTLTTEPIVSVRTFQSGSLLYIESGAGSDIARVGLETQWGGSIVEVSLNGTNFVNLHDTGREVQAAQYDGNALYDACAGCTGAFGWDPVQGGDKYNHGSPVLAQTVINDALYIKAQGYQWNPDDKGGGSGQPILADTYVEASISAVTSHAYTFRVHYKVTHFGADQHANSIQEFPAVYCNLEYGRFVTYTGTAPWTAGELSSSTMTQLGQPSTRPYTPEHWGALVKDNDIGLTVFVPASGFYPGGFMAPGDSGPTGFGTNYFAPMAVYTFGPNSVLEGDVYLVAGDYKHARQVIYDLHNHIAVVDIMAPLAVVEQPLANSQISGKVNVSGWAMDDTAVSKVDVYVDGVLAGNAIYGGSRSDVGKDFPHAPAAIGYGFLLDTSQYGNGAHAIEVRVLDSSGNLAVLQHVPVSIQN